MKLTVLATASLLMISSLLFPLTALPQSTDTEVEALLKAQTLLEEKPFDAKAGDVRAAAMRWVIDTDKVTVTICGDMFASLENYTYNSELLAQYAIGMAAFKLTKPTKAVDENAVQIAGLESALTSYQAMVKERPNAKSPFMADLLKKKTDGELAEFVRKNNCVKLKTA